MSIEPRDDEEEEDLSADDLREPDTKTGLKDPREPDTGSAVREPDTKGN
jgi:hypothetical protein